MARTHFVYRAWDEFGHLLYIGCTKQPTTRWKQHVAEKHVWTQYAQRFLVSGPYGRQDAFDREREAIAAEGPYFNATSEDRRSAHANHAERNRRLLRLRQQRPDLVTADYGTELWDEWEREYDRIHDEVAATHPIHDADWRHARYLNALHDRRAAA